MCTFNNINKTAYFTQHAQCAVFTLLSTGGETWPGFKFYVVTRSYSGRPFLYILDDPQPLIVWYTTL